MNAFVISMILVGGFLPACAQSMDDLKLQVHGFATQGFLYSSSNNWNTTESSSGSAAWNETVLNVSSEPTPRLRIGVQARYFLLGNYGNEISLDWAQADVRVNDRLGVRIGKVKTPSGLFNEVQDIDPAMLWITLPQSIYPIASRTTLLSHYGGVVYGSLPVGERFGRIEYRGFAGSQIVDNDDGVLQPERDNGTTFPSGLKGTILGSTLRWRTPVHGLLVGTSFERERHTGTVNTPNGPGTFDSGLFVSSFFFAQYEHGPWMAAAEYNRFPPNPTTFLPGQPPSPNPSDARNSYAMVTRKLTNKLSSGAYYSYSLDRKAPYDQNRYQKDWTLAARYDFNSFLYVKVEQHVVNGTAIGFSSQDNPTLDTHFNLSLLKLGASF